jgi:hypothetical protein
VVYPTAAPAPMVIMKADLAPAPGAAARPPLARTLVASVDLIGDQVVPPLDPATIGQVSEVTYTVRGDRVPRVIRSEGRYVTCT